MLSMWRVSLSLVLLHGLAAALKFDLIAQPPHSKNERCIRNFVNRDTLVVVTATLDGNRGDGQIVNMHVGPHRVQEPRSVTALPSLGRSSQEKKPS